MSGKRITVYAIIASCIIGIAAVAFVIFRYTPTDESFSELYFENQEQLPDEVRVGEEESFAFTVVSHEVEKSSYHYAVKFDDKVIKEGTFTLLPQEKSTVHAKFSASDSSIVCAESKTDTWRTNFGLSNIVGVTWPGGKTVESTPEGKTVESIPLLKPEDGNLILPIKFSYDGTTESYVLLKINPRSKDEFRFSYTKRVNVESEGKRIGYNLEEEKQTIGNEYGEITFIHEATDSQYRYEKKKVSVEVSANGKEYVIHFWTVVEESSKGE